MLARLGYSRNSFFISLWKLCKFPNLVLQFQKVFCLSMPARSDKRDAMALGTFLTGIDMEWASGVAPEEIPLKASPQNWNKDERPGTLGVWRGHMNIFQR